MATFPDLASFDHFVTETVTADPLVLPIRGRSYSFDPGKITAGAYLKMQRVEQETRQIAAKIARGEKIDPNIIVMDDESERRFGIELLGQANLNQMVDDGLLWTEVQHVMSTVMAYYLAGERAALAIWSGEGVKPADPPARAASTKTAGSSTTRPKVPRSAGQKSSRAGTSSNRTSTGSTK